MQTLPTALRYFHEVATTGSISEAAETQHVSPSAISRQISQLERQIGSPVFRRHARGMELTDAGVLLLTHTRRVQAEGEQLLQDLGQISSGISRSIKVVSSEGLAASVTPRAIAAFCKLHPQVSVHLTVLPSADAARQIVEGTADIATVFTLGLQRDVQVEYSRPAPAFAVLATGHPLAGKSQISLEELCRYPLSMTAKGITQRELFDIAMSMAGLTPNIALTTDHINPAMEFARSGAGVTLLSQFARDSALSEGLEFIRIDHPAFAERTAQILTMPRRRQPALVTALIQHITDVMKSS
ncbi:LysR family transcriptional regulator [Glutamicibacter halophytocola]|uniref:LysR family transcriptional regulator n=1 Tax=Glutamicibacter halophytocola TaxID=1933880 RepID=A0ABX5Y4G7_9MICC|nr:MULTISPECIES: LysR family transcriptional regulator [Glutamicibacter]MBF6672290.1 LysR family transcriptional regulator [Glutamicibacter sp. FBE19]NQD42089.1 LysR family transcriptional regulator [Glutamicibacter halophytocola]QDY64997.1 LysR family transcriptional regulator [Glutamicibacter halophytocola]